MRALWHLRAVIFFLQAKLNVMPGIGSGEKKKGGGREKDAKKPPPKEVPEKNVEKFY